MGMHVAWGERFVEIIGWGGRSEAMAGKRRCTGLSWMAMLVVALIADVCCVAPTSSWARARGDETEESLEQTAKRLGMFVEKLPAMPALRGYRTTGDGNFVPANLTIGMYMKKWRFHRDLPPSTVYAYGVSKHAATVPGPTIWAMAGVPTHVLWENRLPSKHIFATDGTLEVAKPPSGGVPTVVHLHGSISEPASDGSAEAWFTAGFAHKGPAWKKAVYTYHNVKHGGVGANLWYHDHAMGYTRLNLLAGLVGAYSVRDPALDDRLPTKKFARHLVVFDKSFTRHGHIYINATGDNPHIHPEWQPEYFGVVVMVNGKAWPHLKVQRRKYRFRIINASNARFYEFALTNGMNFTQIGADSFYLERPIALRSILVAPSETVDVVVDFSTCPANETVLTNSAPFPFPDGDEPDERTGQVMKFVVKAPRVRDRSVVPDPLPAVPRLSPGDAAANRTIVLYEFDSPSGDPTHLLINFLKFSDPPTETPSLGSVELWHILNLTPDNHPLHVHLAPFQVLAQQALFNTDELSACVARYRGVDRCRLPDHVNATVEPPPANEAGWKTVFKMKPLYLTQILLRFALPDSSPFPFDATADPGYAYHCHILDHEDNSMMRPYKIVH